MKVAIRTRFLRELSDCSDKSGTAVRKSCFCIDGPAAIGYPKVTTCLFATIFTD